MAGERYLLAGRCPRRRTILAAVKARLWIAALLVLASCGSSVAKPSDGSTAAATRCGPAGAKTLAANGRVRVYVSGQGVYGCSTARSRTFRLGNVSRSIRESRAGPVAVAGDLAAYGLSRFGVDTVRAAVVVRRLTDGKQLRQLSATRAVGAEAFVSVGSVVMKANGAVAWIGVEHSIGAGRRSSIEVHAASAQTGTGTRTGGDRVLDSGPAIRPASLRLHGSRLSWVNGGTARHAALR
jgi:hypothetical protein